MASANVKKAILKKKVGDVVYDLLVKTSADLVEVSEDTTLTQKLEELNTLIQGKATASDITTAIDNLINSAPETYNTLGEIATWIQEHQSEFEGLQAIAGKPMQGTDGETEGKAGIVPAPQTTDKDKFLKGDGTWGTPTNTTYEKASTDNDGLMSKEDFSKLQGLENFDSAELEGKITTATETANTAKATAEEAKTAVDEKARVILDKTEPVDLAESDLFLQDLTEE